MNDSKQIVSNFVWKFSERIFARGIEFGISVVLARLLSPDDFGVISMVLVFITLADVFVSSGFSTALIQKKNANETDFSTMFYCSLASSVIVYSVIFLCAPYISEFYNMHELTLVTRVFALRIPLSVYNSIQHAYVSRHMMFKRFFFSTLFGTVLSGVVGILLALNGFGVWALISQYFVNTIVDTLVLAFTVHWYPKLLFSRSSAAELMSYGWKILFAEFSGNFFGQLRSLVIGRYYSASDLAIYNKGQQIPGLIYTNIGTSITTVLFPAMANINDDKEDIKRILRESTQILSYVLFPILIGLACVSKTFVITLFTEKWIAAVPFVIWMCFDYCIAVWGINILPALKAIGESGIVLKLEFLKKPVFIVLLIVGVKTNLTAVAITMVLYELYGTLVNIISSKKYLDYSLKESVSDIFPALIQSLIMGAAVYLLQFIGWSSFVTLMIQVICGIILYIVMSAFTHNRSFMFILNYLKRFTK